MPAITEKTLAAVHLRLVGFTGFASFLSGNQRCHSLSKEFNYSPQPF